MKKNFLITLFIFVFCIVFASERTDIIDWFADRNISYFYSNKTGDVIAFSITEDDLLLKQKYTVNKDGDIKLKDSTEIDLINCSYKEFDSVVSHFNVSGGSSDDIMGIKEYIHSINYSYYKYYNLIYYVEGDYSNDTQYFYIPGNRNKDEIKKYLSIFKNNKCYFHKEIGEHIPYFYTDEFPLAAYYDEYGYLNIIDIDSDFNLNRQMWIIGQKPVLFTLNYDKNGTFDEKELSNKVLNTFFVDSYINFSASSVLTDKSYKYSPDNLNFYFSKQAYGYRINYDNLKMKKNPVPWVEGVNGPGIGEYVEIDMSKASTVSVYHDIIYILNGYVDPLKPYLFKENNRIKKAKIETNTGYSEEIQFNDCVEFTSFSVPEGTKTVKITILEVYKGSKYDDTCITSISFVNSAWGK